MIMDCWGGAKIRCEFSKTQINTDNIVLKTIFHNVPDSTLYVKPETIRKENTLIQGKNGEELVLTKKGQVMGKSEFNATGGNSVLLKEYHRKSDSLAQWQINFSKYDAQTYAFDYLGSGNHGIFSGADYYPQSGSYDFRYKSVECGKNDKVIVEFDTYPEADSVVFKDKYGVTYPISLKDNVLSFTGVSKADTNFIYAYRGDKKIGKLFLNTYQRKIYKVVFVRVNGAAKKLNEEKVQEHLNKVYNQCAVKFEIETAKLDLPDLTSFSHGGSGILTVYNEDQKRVLQAYDKKMKDGVYYLFFVDNVTDKKDGSGTPVSGYMPRGYSCGFIYDGGSERTIAHELGHGIAGLEHVFENSNNSGKTANLMDYANGEELWHFQWDQIQDPSRVWMKWNKAESEGENQEKFDLKNVKWHPLENPISGIFIAPSRLPIWIDDVTEIFVLKYSEVGVTLRDDSPAEAIYGFKTSGGETFVARFSTSDKFEGFYNGDTRYVDKAKNTITKFGYEGNPIHYWVAFQSETEPKGELKTAQDTQGYTIPVPSNGAWDNYSAIINETAYYEVYLGELGQTISGMFLAPSDMPIWIDNVTDVLVSKTGNAIYGFKTENHETFLAKNNGNEFQGFFNVDTDILYIDKNTFTLKAYGETGYPIYYWDNSINAVNNTNDEFVAHKLPMDIYSDDNYSAVPHITLYFEPQTADDMHCYVLYRRYRDKDSPLFNDQVWKTAIENNPCVLRGIVKFNPNMDKSEWMKEFDRFVSISMNVALFPAVMDILIGPFIGEILENQEVIGQLSATVSVEQAYASFHLGAATDFFCTSLVTYLTSDKENWMEDINEIDALADAAFAGVQNLVSIKKYKKLVNAGFNCLSNVNITDVPEIVSDADKLGKVLTDCGIGFVFGYLFSTKLMEKLMTWATKTGPDKLIQIFRRKIPVFENPMAEVDVLSKLAKRPDDWKNGMLIVLQKQEGIDAFNFLKKCDYSYLRLSAMNFDRLSLIYSEIGDAERKKLQDLLTQGCDANLLILSIHQLKSIEKNTSKAVNSIADGVAKCLKNKQPITLDGTSYSLEEFMVKHHGDFLSYKYSVDKDAIHIIKFDKIYNYACEVIIQPGIEAFTIKSVSSDKMKNYMKDKTQYLIENVFPE